MFMPRSKYDTLLDAYCPLASPVLKKKVFV